MPIHPETELIPYLRGELQTDEHERIASHLAGCAECRETADASTRVLSDLARRIESIPEPDWTRYRMELRRKLRARDEVRAPWWRARPGFAWLSIGAGAAVAAIVTLMLVTRPSGTVVPPVDQLAMIEAPGDPDVDMLQNYKVVEDLDLLENYDVIQDLDQVSPAAGGNVPSQS